MLEALAVDLDTSPEVSVVAPDATVKAGIDVNLAVDLGLDGLLPENFDLVQVDELVHLDRVF